MDIIIISGFLGSGKTTLLLRIAKSLVEDSGRKIAIIENEIGKVGVDDQTIAAEGLTVKELFSGCVCCSLRLDLINTLLELERNVNPDIVIIEPSGVAGPDLLLGALLGYGGTIDRKLVINIIDASRAKIILKKPLLPIIEKGLKVADIILVNKIDCVQPEDIKAIEEGIREFRENAEIAFISALSGLGMESISDRFVTMLSPLEKNPVKSSSGELELTDSDATVFSEKFSFTFDPHLSADDVRGKLAGILKSLSLKLKNCGCTMIGHIKLILKDGDKPGYLLMSITDFDMEATARGRIGDNLRNVTLTLNAIVYGVDSLTLSYSARELVHNNFP